MSRRESLPICQRPADLLFVLWYINFLFSVTFTDIHNFTASILGIDVHEMEGQVNMVWPPPVLTDIYFRWARTVDPLLYKNPMFWQVMEWINILVLMPFSAYAIYGFFVGSNRMRMPAIITNSFTWYSLMICIFSTLYGPKEDQTPDVNMFLAVYLPYLIFPMCIIVRLWHEDPFSHETFSKRSGFKRLLDSLVVMVMVVSFAFYFYYIFLWFEKHYASNVATVRGPLRRTDEL